MALDLTGINVHNRRFLLLFLIVSALVMAVFQNAERDKKLNLPLFDRRALVYPIYQGVSALRMTFQVPMEEYYIFKFSADDLSCLTTCERLAAEHLADNLRTINLFAALFYGYLFARYWQWQYRTCMLEETAEISRTLFRMLSAWSMAVMFLHLTIHVIFFMAKFLISADFLVSQTDLFYVIASAAILSLTGKFSYELVRVSQQLALKQEGYLPQSARFFAIAWVIIAFWIIPWTNFSVTFF